MHNLPLDNILQEIQVWTHYILKKPILTTLLRSEASLIPQVSGLGGAVVKSKHISIAALSICFGLSTLISPVAHAQFLGGIPALGSSALGGGAGAGSGAPLSAAAGAGGSAGVAPFGAVGSGSGVFAGTSR